MMPSQSTLLLAALLACAAPAQAAKYKLTWLGNDAGGAAAFKAAVEKATHGDVEVTATMDRWADANQAESDPEVARRVVKGGAQIGQSYLEVIGKYEPRLMIFEAPYLIKGYEHMEGIIDGPVGAELLDGLRAKGLVGLTISYNGGANGLASKRAIKAPADLKGMKVGVYGDEGNAEWLRALGATPVVVSHKAPLDGALDATVLTWKNFEITENNSVYKNFSLPGSSFLVTVTYANKEFLEGLPSEYRAMILDLAKKTARVERARTIARNRDCRKSRLAAGVAETTLSAAAKKSFLDALRPYSEKQLEPRLGKELLKRVQDAGDGVVARLDDKAASGGR